MRLPYFPLHAVLFPHLPLPLHIFEERYRVMTRDVLGAGSPFAGRFVVSMITEGPEVVEGRAVPPAAEPTRARSIGTVAEVRSADQLPDGGWVLLVVGIARAEIGRIDRDGPYPLAEVTPLPELAGDGADGLLPQVQQALDGYLATVKRFVAATASKQETQTELTDVATSLDAVLKPIHLPDDVHAASYAVAGVLQVELTRKQHLLELPDAASRLRAELDLLRRESRLLADGAMPPVAPGALRYNPN
jgi:Lon protease-like protein